MDQPMARRRSGSLELDYGDDPLQDQDQDQDQPPLDTSATASTGQPQVSPIATLETAKRDAAQQSQSRPKLQFTPSGPTVSSNGTGLPANPLTGKIPSNPGSSVPPTATIVGGSLPGNISTGNGHTSVASTTNSQMTAVFISDMHWWTSDQHLVELCHLAGAGGVKLKDVSFSEHKVNGKSKGVAYIETGSIEGANLVQRYVDQNEYQQKRMTCTQVIGSNLGSPFRTLPREPHARQQQGQGSSSTSSLSNNPANQSQRPGLRIPPPCTYPYINSRDNGGAGGGGGGGGNAGGGGTMGGNKRQFTGRDHHHHQQQQQPPHQQPMQQGGGMAMGGIGMNGMNGMNGIGMSSIGGGMGGGNRPQNFNSNPGQNQNSNQSGMMTMGGMGGMPASTGVGGMGGFDGMGGMGGMNMFGMNPFGMGMFGGGGGGGVGFGGTTPQMNAFGGTGGFDMTQFGTGMDFGQMSPYGMMSPNQQVQHNGGGGQVKRGRTDG